MNYPNLEHAIEVIAQLRHPTKGCPWDLEQTHESLLKYLIEESYEYVHATEAKDYQKMQEELGDVLLQILLHSQIASEGKHFDIDTVAKTLADKMIRRHPHVFEDPSLATTSEEVLSNWEKIKKKEKEKKHKYFINTEDTHMPALMSAQKIGKKSKKINFDWDNIAQVLDKVHEEIEEVKAEINTPKQNQQKIHEEVGDLLFSVVQLARHLNVDAEEALRDANKKFILRINKVEDEVLKLNKKMTDFPTSELEKIWVKIKKNG